MEKGEMQTISEMNRNTNKKKQFKSSKKTKKTQKLTNFGNTTATTEEKKKHGHANGCRKRGLEYDKFQLRRNPNIRKQIEQKGNTISENNNRNPIRRQFMILRKKKERTQKAYHLWEYNSNNRGKDAERSKKKKTI